MRDQEIAETDSKGRRQWKKEQASVKERKGKKKEKEMKLEESNEDKRFEESERKR